MATEKRWWSQATFMNCLMNCLHGKSKKLRSILHSRITLCRKSSRKANIKPPREAFDEYGDDIIEYYDGDDLIDVLSTKLYDVGLWRLTDLMLAKLRRTNNVEKSWAEEAIGHFQNAINEISKKSGLSIKAETKPNGELKISTDNNKI